MIHFHHVNLHYPHSEVKALMDINLEVAKGEFIFLIGHSGAGKSSLLNMVLKRLEPTTGTVYVGGEPLKQLRGDKIALHRRKIGVVFQDHQLLKDRSVEENLLLTLRVLGVPKLEWQDRMQHVLRQVGLVHKKRAHPSQLSVGESQRIAVARAIIGSPTIVLADEPTGNLDPDNAQTVMDLFKSIHLQGATVIMATHSRELVESYNSRVVVVKDGQIIRDDKHGHFALD